MALQDVTPQRKAEYSHVKWLDDKTKPSDKAVNVAANEWVEGHVISYDPESGGWDFNQQIVGHALIVTENEVTAKITLDKPRLQQCFKTCAEDPENPDDLRGVFVRVTYLGWLESKKPGGSAYKGFRVQQDPEKFSETLASKKQNSSF